MFPFVFIRNFRFFGKLIGIIIVLFLIVGLYLRGNHYKNGYIKYKNAFELQKIEVEKCTKELNKLAKLYKNVVEKSNKLQEIHKKSIKKYKSLLEECIKEKAKCKEEIKIIVSDRKDCPKIQEFKDEKLNKLYEFFKENKDE
ncbi:MAG TPA: hypothetical protein ENG63_02340 [Candidatus Desulfofervidus auxilii]|uniref:Uncharacterized protein n=1 Tax=Desulfofervidus auxilii TaxID=1621989 RepID=A0A7C0Y1V0_DESA2|nr:hypothetical protein [Candidatus Desulfofervidus auxilii]